MYMDFTWHFDTFTYYFTLILVPLGFPKAQQNNSRISGFQNRNIQKANLNDCFFFNFVYNEINF